MTNEEAAHILHAIKFILPSRFYKDYIEEALNMGMDALKERTKTHECVCDREETHEERADGDLISRQAVIDNIKTRLYQTALNNTENITSYANVCEDIAENRIDTWVNEVKSVEPERKTGKWERYCCTKLHDYYKCTECNRVIETIRGASLKEFPYCHCGAKMVDEAESEDKE